MPCRDHDHHAPGLHEHGPRLGVTADRLFLGAERRRSGTLDNPPFDHGCQTVGYLSGELKVLLYQQDRDAIVAEEPDHSRQLAHDPARSYAAKNNLHHKSHILSNLQYAS